VLAVPSADRAGRGGARGVVGDQGVITAVQATLRARAWSNAVAMRTVFLLGCACVAACTASASEVRPPQDQLFFPTGMAVAPGESVLFVANSNSELRYDSGSVIVLDLASVDQVIADWTGPGKVIPQQGEAKGCYQDTDHSETLVCDESMFVLSEAGARIGNFATDVAVQDLHDGRLRLIVPTRGDPSITWIDWDGTKLSCNASTGGFVLCDQDHRLSFVHNDPNLELMPNEPFMAYADSSANFAVVTHLTSSAVTLVDSPPSGNAIIADVSLGLFQPDPSTGLTGSTGVAGRSPGASDIVYVGSRSESRVQTLTVGTPVNYTPGGDPDHSRFFIPGNFFFLDFVGAAAGASTDTRGMTFDSSGNNLYVVNRHPPSVQIYDTSLGPEGFPNNRGVAATDICREASTITVLDTSAGERAFVTCFQDGEVYVVDPSGIGSVEDIVEIGRGPFSVAAAQNRSKVYVSNFLEDTISVLDVSPTSATHDRVVLRIGTPRAP
jgi:DNA-binding beta-propeller fold protein YncE